MAAKCCSPYTASWGGGCSREGMQMAAAIPWLPPCAKRERKVASWVLYRCGARYMMWIFTAFRREHKSRSTCTTIFVTCCGHHTHSFSSHPSPTHWLGGLHRILPIAMPSWMKQYYAWLAHGLRSKVWQQRLFSLPHRANCTIRVGHKQNFVFSHSPT